MIRHNGKEKMMIEERVRFEEVPMCTYMLIYMHHDEVGHDWTVDC